MVNASGKVTTKDQNRSVRAILKGCVIDHIEAGQAVHIVRLLKLNQGQQTLTLGLNLESKSQGRKDLIKIENLHLSESQMAQVALFSPHATVNMIDDFKVSAKYPLTLPTEVKGIFQCYNPNCITRDEPVLSKFYVKAHGLEVRLNCHYCQVSFPRQSAQVVD